MKRIIGYPDKKTALEIANSKDGKKRKCVVRKNKIKLFGKSVPEYGVFCK
jgi:hypothetical protein